MNTAQPRPRRGGLSQGDPAQDGEAVRGGRPAGGRARRRRPGARSGARPLRNASRHVVPARRRRARLHGRPHAYSARIWAPTSPKGKMTLPLIRAAAVGTPADAALIRAAIAKGNDDRFHARHGRAGAHRRARLRARAAPSRRARREPPRWRRCRPRRTRKTC